MNKGQDAHLDKPESYAIGHFPNIRYLSYPFNYSISIAIAGRSQPMALAGKPHADPYFTQPVTKRLVDQTIYSLRTASLDALEVGPSWVKTEGIALTPRNQSESSPFF